MITFDVATEVLLDFWWRRIPLAAARFSHILSLMLSEGIYLVAWPGVAAFTPLVALFVGCIAGFARFGGQEVFTQSPVILFLASFFGFLSAQVGAMFVLGYALVDFLVFPHRTFAYGAFLTLPLALLIIYLALAVLAVGIPLLVHAIRSQLSLSLRMTGDLAVIIDSMTSGLIGGALVFLYLHGTPMLIRPLYVWHNWLPPASAVELVQNQAEFFAFIVVALVVFRVLLEYAAASIAAEEIQAALDNIPQQAGVSVRVPAIARAVLLSVVGTVLLSGLQDVWSSTLLLFTTLFCVGLARTVLSTRFGAWPQTMEKIPALIRLIAALGVAYCLTTLLLNGRLYGSSFRPLVVALVLCIICMAAAFPQTSSQHHQS